MYVPNHFAEADLAALHALMRAHSFALLASARAGEAPFATHLPLIVDASRGELGTLIGHVARANGHWRHFDGKSQALAVFSGPHAYVVGALVSERAPGAHLELRRGARGGRAARDRRPARAFELLRNLMSENESALPEAARTLGKGPRELADIPFVHLDKLLRGIVAFELPIERIEGKRKLSQNKKPNERRGLIAGLRAAGGADAAAVADAMQAALDAEPSA